LFPSRLGAVATGALAIGLLWFLVLPVGGTDSFNGDWLTHPAIQYASRPTHDLVAELNRRIEQGDNPLSFEGPSGYLRSTLDALGVPVESQIALFLRDSQQAARITPFTPRTIFFNDRVVVAWVRGGFIEIAAAAPENAVVFYTLEQTPVDKPEFRRRVECLSCHHSYATSGVPGTLLRAAGRYVVEQSVPLEQRWGGWYVTGRLGAIHHAGNITGQPLFDSPPPAAAEPLLSIAGTIDTASYLSTHSDVVALLVFDHQMRMMNLLSRIGWEVQIAEHDGADPSEPARTIAKELVDYMLFVDEAPLADAVEGSSRFAETFTAGGVRDRRGRSLRQLDLKRRLMRYPCSYMIYTPTFDALPAAAKDAIYRRLSDVLSGRERDAKYTRLSAANRTAIIEILRDTKSDLPRFF
jgi:hypothetical protein